MERQELVEREMLGLGEAVREPLTVPEGESVRVVLKAVAVLQGVAVGEWEGVLLCVALRLGEGVPLALGGEVAEAVRVPAPAAACSIAGVAVKEGRSREALGGWVQGCRAQPARQRALAPTAPPAAPPAAPPPLLPPPAPAP